VLHGAGRPAVFRDLARWAPAAGRVSGGFPGSFWPAAAAAPGVIIKVITAFRQGTCKDRYRDWPDTRTASVSPSKILLRYLNGSAASSVQPPVTRCWITARRGRVPKPGSGLAGSLIAPVGDHVPRPGRPLDPPGLSITPRPTRSAAPPRQAPAPSPPWG